MITLKEQSVDTDETNGEKISVKKPKSELKTIKFVAVQLSKDQYKIGEDELNDYLKKGFVVIKDFQTSSGLIFALGAYKKGDGFE